MDADFTASAVAGIPSRCTLSRGLRVVDGAGARSARCGDLPFPIGTAGYVVISHGRNLQHGHSYRKLAKGLRASAGQALIIRVMNFNELVPAPRGRQICRALLRAMTIAYAENAQRFDPEDLGDNNTTFGVNVVHNLRHLVEIEVEGIEGLIVRRAKNSFWLEIDGLPLYIYKAPPGCTSVHGMRFDESDLRLEILEQNTCQLQFDLDGHQRETTASIQSPRLHPVVTHFGSPEAGFTHASIGAPYKAKDGSCEWSWIEPFQEDDSDTSNTAADDPRVPGDLGEDFALQLRDDREDESAEGRQ